MSLRRDAEKIAEYGISLQNKIAKNQNKINRLETALGKAKAVQDEKAIRAFESELEKLKREDTELRDMSDSYHGRIAAFVSAHSR